jgi:SH3-like domain-containing protein
LKSRGNSSAARLVARSAFAAALAVAALAPARAAEFRCAGEAGAVLYDAPSREGTPLFVVSKDYPLEIIVQTEAWAKVRDEAGALTWVEKKSLGDKRMVIVASPRVDVHKSADENSPVSFSAVRDVALEVVGVLPGWLHVRHADGAEGWLKPSQVWGG